MKLLIAGDYVPNGRFADCLSSMGGYDFGIMRHYCEQVDYSIVNFEAPVVIGQVKGIRKNGPNLRVSTEAVDGIKKMGFHCVTLANNHFRDYGDEGVQTTISVLEGKGLDYVGGGRTLNEACKVIYKKLGQETVAIVNFCENEFSIATEKRSGSMPLDIIDNYHQIKLAKSKSDYVVVIVHGGHEGYQLPSLRMKKLYRFFVEIGADVVVNHHQHCFSGYEIYQGKPIFYGLGNFIFDRNYKRHDIWNEGFFVTLDLQPSIISYEITPYRQCDDYPGVFPIKEDKRSFNEIICKLNAIIADDKRLDEEFELFVQKKSRGVMATLSPFANRYIMALIVRGLLPLFVSKKKGTMLYNYISCEAHRDITLRSISKLIE